MKKILSVLLVMLVLSTSVSAYHYSPYVSVDDRTQSEHYERRTSYEKRDTHVIENGYDNGYYPYGAYNSYSRDYRDFYERSESFERIDTYDRTYDAYSPNYGSNRYASYRPYGHDYSRYDRYGYYRNPSYW